MMDSPHAVLSGAAGHQTWAGYLASPVRHAHPDRLLACFVSAGPVLARLVADRRFEARLAELLTERFTAEGQTCEPPPLGPDILSVNLPRDDLDSLALPCGSVFWAEAFVREIRKPVVALLTERFGEAAFSAALTHRDLAGGRPIPANLDALEHAILADGRACLAAWLQSLPAPVAARVMLKWPNADAVPTTADAVLLERGPAILRRVVADRYASGADGR